MNKFTRLKYIKFYDQYNEVTEKKDRFIFSSFDYENPETEKPVKIIPIPENSRKTAEKIFKKISGVDISNEKYKMKQGIINFADKTTSEIVEINAKFEGFLENFIVINYLKTC